MLLVLPAAGQVGCPSDWERCPDVWLFGDVDHTTGRWFGVIMHDDRTEHTSPTPVEELWAIWAERFIKVREYGYISSCACQFQRLAP